MEKCLYVVFSVMCKFGNFHSFLVGLCESRNEMVRDAAYSATVDYIFRKEA